jgi:hypothetical protein
LESYSEASLKNVKLSFAVLLPPQVNLLDVSVK